LLPVRILLFAFPPSKRIHAFATVFYKVFLWLVSCLSTFMFCLIAIANP
jgi:hypothetical protein